MEKINLVLLRKIFKKLFQINYLLILFFLSSCSLFEKDKEVVKQEVLPSSTTEGLNTFGCKVNGEVWLPGGVSDFSPKGNRYKLYFTLTDTVFGLNGEGYFLVIYPGRISRDQMISEYFSLKINNITQEGQYKFYLPKDEYCFTRKFNDSQKIINYSLQDTPNNYVNITKFDLKNNIISGNFGLTATSKNGEKVYITDGVFDLNLLTK